VTSPSEPAGEIGVRMRVATAFGCLVVVLVSPSMRPLAAQTVDVLPRGTRVRIVAPAAGVIWPARAVLDSVGSDTVFLRELSEPPSMRRLPRVAIPLASVRRFEIPTTGPSRSAHARTGALLGIGVYLLYAGAYVVRERSTCDGSDCFGEGMAWIGLAERVPVAAGAGAMVGLAIPVRRWRAIPTTTATPQPTPPRQ
jgi:hypothetical protein